MKEQNRRVLIIGLTWPEPQATAAGVRMMQLISLWKSYNYQITFSSAAALSPGGKLPEIPGVEFSRIRLNHRSFDDFISALDPCMVIFDRFLTEEYFGWRITRTLPQAIRIVDTEDLHSLRKARELAQKKGMVFEPNIWRSLEITKRELASLFRADMSLIISSFEMDWLRSHMPSLTSQLFYLPFVFEEADLAPHSDRPSFKKRNDFVFIGNGRHLPNTDAIRYLKKEVWPKIRKELPEANLNIYGAHLPREITALTDPEEHFFVKGWVPEVAGMLSSARVNLIPLRFGAGLKGKLFEAMRCGTPSAMSSIAAEGTGFANMPQYVGDSPGQLASVAVNLYRDESRWCEMQKKGDAILRSEFSRKDFAGGLKKRLDLLQTNLEKEREENLIGNMLLHHTMASSRYLSKYIGLKEEIARQKQK